METVGPAPSTPRKGSASIRRENRVAAMQYLYQWSVNPPVDLNDDLERFFYDRGKDLDRPATHFQFAEELVRGVLSELVAIDEVIKRYAKNWEFSRVARIDLAILRLAVYEMMFRRDIPPIVSINEAIDLSKTYSIPDAKRFINGILDQYKLTLDRPLRTADL